MSIFTDAVDRALGLIRSIGPEPLSPLSAMGRKYLDIKGTAAGYGVPFPATRYPEFGIAQPTPTTAPTPTFEGLGVDAPEEELAKLIVTSAEESEVDPSLLAALLFQESSYDIGATNPESPDYGIAQINLPSHPGVTKEQAFDPKFAIPFAAKKLASDINYFDDINRGLAAYNVGRGGASVRGQEAFGGGPKGQRYIINVARNLTSEARKRLGLITDLD